MSAAVIECVVGEPIELFKDSMIVVAEKRRATSLSGDLPVYDQIEDRFRIVPTSPGSYQMTFACGGFSKTFTVRATSMPVSPPSKSIVFMGDSGTDHDGDTAFPGIVRLALPTLTCLGTRGTTTKHEGWAGRSNPFFANDPTSPLTNGGVVPDIPHYFTLIGAVPDVVLESNGSNDFFSTIGNDAAVEAAITASFVARDQIRTAWRAVGGAAANTIFVYTTIWPGNYLESAWDANYPLAPRPTRDLYRRAHARWCERSFASYGGREAEGIYMLHTAAQMSGVQDYPLDNAFHFTLAQGHVRTARCMRHFIVGRILS